METIYDYPIKIKFEMPPKLSSKEKCALDTEWFGMDKDRLHRPVKLDGSPNGTFACLTLCWDGETVYFITDPNDIQTALDNINDSVWVLANLKFVSQSRSIGA